MDPPKTYGTYRVASPREGGNNMAKKKAAKKPAAKKAAKKATKKK